MDTKVVLIALVAIVVVAGVAFVALGDDSEDPIAQTESKLPVYGNANNDDFINDEDINKIKEIINGSWDKEKYAFADANKDGAVTDEDTEFVQDMIDGKEMTIFYKDAKGGEHSVDVPVDKIFVLGYQGMFALQVLDKHTDVVGRDDMKKTSNMRDEVLNHTIYEKADPISPSPFKADMGMVTEVIEKNKKAGNSVDVLVTAFGSYAKGQEDQLGKLGIDVVRGDIMDRDCSNVTVLTLGYILNSERLAHEYVKFMEDLGKDVKEKLDTLPSKDREVKCLMNVWGNYLFTAETGDSKDLNRAGGVNPLTAAMVDGADVKELAKGETWYLGREFNVPFMIVKGAFKYNTPIENVAAYWDQGMEAATWDKMMPDHYKDGIVLINYQIPPMMMVAYMAEFLHSDVFPEGYADGFHQQMVDKFVPDLVAIDYVVADHFFSSTYDDLKDLIKIHATA